jgi:glycosyltransferase 2 family protein
MAQQSHRYDSFCPVDYLSNRQQTVSPPHHMNLSSYKARFTAYLKSLIQLLQHGWQGKAVAGLFFLLSIAILAAIIASNWDTLTEYDWQIQPIWLGYALLFLAVDLFLGSYAWHMLVSRLTTHNDLQHNIKSWHYANLARRVPGTIWYIASRALLYEKRGLNKRTTSLLSGLELVIILFSGIATFILTLPFWVMPDEVTTQINQSWLFLIIVPICFLLVHPTVLNKIWSKVSEAPPAKLLWRDTGRWLIVYLVVWFFGGCVLFSVINLFQPLPWSQLIPVTGMWIIASVVSLAGTLAFSGMGLREISLTLLLAQVVPLPVALIIAIVLRLLWLLGELVAALLSLLL